MTSFLHGLVFKRLDYYITKVVTGSKYIYIYQDI
jgi:hypothetical protein